MGKDYSIFDNMLEGCRIISYDWRYLYVNDTAAMQNHVKKENILGKKVMEVYPSIEKTELFFRLQKCMRERVSASMENEFTFSSGDTAWFEIRIEPVPEGIFVLSVDITERKQMEEKNRMILESMAENYIELDNKWHYKYINKRIEHAVGKKKEELIGKHPYDVFPVLRGSMLCKKLKEAREKNEPLSFEVKIPINGQWVKMHVYPSDEGITIYSHDITGRRTAEEKTERHDKLLEGINQILHGSLILETEEEVAGICLEVAEDLTGSEFGFLSEINSNGGLSNLAMSPQALEAFKGSLRKARELVTEMENVSYWRRIIKEEKSQIVNDHDRKGFPEGHPKITSFVGVPLKQSNKTVGIIALANKEGGYTSEDVENVEAISIAFVEALMRKRAEIKLKESYDILEKRVEERTSELEEAYSSLKESEEKFRGIFDNATDMISLIAGSEYGKSRYIEVNEAGLNRLGYSREEILSMGPSNIDKEPETQKHIENLFKTGHTQFETFHIAKDGNKIPVEVIIHCIDYRGMKVGLEISRDISERKKAEERINQYKDRLEELVKKIRESEAHFKSLVENSPNLIVRVDRELNYLYVNPTVTKFTGKSPEFFIGKNLEEIETSKEHRSLWREKYQKALKTGNVQHMEFEFHTISGLRFFERVIIPEYNDKGEIETALSISIDITERKEAEIKLEETIGELKRSNDELQRFAYVASHDLQEPLRTISSFTQLLERRYHDKLDSDADEFIEYVVEAAQRMQQMIHDLLDYSRIMTKGKEFEEMSSENLLKEVIISLKTVIDENNALIMYDPLPLIVADRGQIRRVFQNLILNAIKFKKPDEPPMVHISCRKDEENNEYVFSVADNGIGIEKQYFDRIFTIFQRLHTLDEYHGTGIGLSVVKRIIDRHKGRIWVESEPGVGSTFYFTIPFRINDV